MNSSDDNLRFSAIFLFLEFQAYVFLWSFFFDRFFCYLRKWTEKYHETIPFVSVYFITCKLSRVRKLPQNTTKQQKSAVCLSLFAWKSLFLSLYFSECRVCLLVRLCVGIFLIFCCGWWFVNVFQSIFL